MTVRDAVTSPVTTSSTQVINAAGTVKQANPFNLGNSYPMIADVTVHVYYPQGGGGGGGVSIIADIQESVDTNDANFTPLGSLHIADTATTGFPKEYHQPVQPRKQFLRVIWTVAGTAPNYGTAQVWLTSASEERRFWP